jgi:DNA-binding NtrC family response regulator
VVLCDVKLPDGNGVDFTKTIKEKFPAIEVILLTAYGNIPDGVKAIKNGAFDYLTKGDDNNKIIPLLFRALDKIELASRVVQLEKQLGNKHSFENIIGKSKVILQAIELAKKVSQTDTTVLLTGETGVGKEVFAQSIHQASNRCKNNFVAINCSAFSKELLENELFGHKIGSFTGASKDQKGLLEEANKGTIFLDEIGEMHIELQAKILRVIENQEFIKIGDSKPTKIDVRIIAATNRDLEKEIENGNFREDLFYRISVFQIQIPALRNRKEDIEMLVNYFVKYFSIKANKKIESISQEALQLLKNHNWKGNIRELKNVIERSSILASSNIIDTDSLPIDIQNNTLLSTSKQLSAFDLASAEKLHILKVLNYTKGNKTETAKLLNIALTTLYRKLADYSIQ